MKTGMTHAALVCATAAFCSAPYAPASGFEIGRSAYGTEFLSSAASPDGRFEVTRFAPRATGRYPSATESVSLFNSELVGDTELSLDAGMAEQERRVTVGIARGAVAAGFFSGSGEDYSRLDPAAPPMDPYFFHGGAAREFDYRGAAVELGLTRTINLQFALSSIEARGFDTRRTSYAGVSTLRSTTGLFTVARGGDSVTQGVDWSYRSDRFTGHARQINHESGARYRSVGLSRDGIGGWYGLSFESGRNPLYRDNEENRVMFRWGGSLGGDKYRLDATDTVENGAPEGDETQATHRGRNLALLAGAVVAIGAASSSGSESQDNVIRIRTQHDAARETLNRINPVSVRQNREYGAWVYRNRDGTFGYTQPIAGGVASVDIGPKSSVPRGTVATASYHTHGGPDPRYNNEEFSPSDILSDNLQRVDGYLGTPAGRFLYHEFRTQRIIVLGRIAN